MRDYLSMATQHRETRMLALISALWMSRLVNFAVKVGVFRALSAGPRQLSDLAAEMGFHEELFGRALDGLVHLGLLRRNRDHFSLSEDGSLLLPDKPGKFCDMATLWHDLFDGAWTKFETSLRTGKSGFELYYGEPIFVRLQHDLTSAECFTRAMRGLSELVSEEASSLIASRMRATGISSLCDVGGGDGLLISRIASRVPEIKCTLFDLPSVIGSVSPTANEDGFYILGGSFFEAVPPADAHILSNVLHDWPDADAVRILKNVRRAQGHTSRLFLLEMMLGGSTEPLLARSTDLNMLVLTGGRERTEEEFNQLLEDAGYQIVFVNSVANLSCLIEAVPKE